MTSMQELRNLVSQMPDTVLQQAMQSQNAVVPPFHNIPILAMIEARTRMEQRQAQQQQHYFPSDTLVQQYAQGLETPGLEDIAQGFAEGGPVYRPGGVYERVREAHRIDPQRFKPGRQTPHIDINKVGAWLRDTFMNPEIEQGILFPRTVTPVRSGINLFTGSPGISSGLDFLMDLALRPGFRHRDEQAEPIAESIAEPIAELTAEDELRELIASEEAQRPLHRQQESDSLEVLVEPELEPEPESGAQQLQGRNLLSRLMQGDVDEHSPPTFDEQIEAMQALYGTPPLQASEIKSVLERELSTKQEALREAKLERGLGALIAMIGGMLGTHGPGEVRMGQGLLTGLHAHLMGTRGIRDMQAAVQETEQRLGLIEPTLERERYETRVGLIDKIAAMEAQRRRDAEKHRRALELEGIKGEYELDEAFIRGLMRKEKPVTEETTKPMTSNQIMVAKNAISKELRENNVDFREAIARGDFATTTRMINRVFNMRFGMTPEDALEEEPETRPVKRFTFPGVARP